MSQKKNGFTLIEVLVVMLIATLVLTTVGGTMVFITTTTGNLIDQAEEIELAKNIEKYLRTAYKNNDIIENNSDTKSNDKVTYILKDKTTNDTITINDIFPDNNLVEFEIYREDSDDNFVRCRMKFESGREFKFIIDTKN